MRIRSLLTQSTWALAQASLVALLVVGLVASTALAARGGGGGGGKPGGGGSGGGGTISLALMDGATEAQYGARVTFTVSTTATAYPWVHLTCSQGGTVVLEGRQGFFPNALGNQWLYLGPTPSWQGGAATCTATLEKSSNKGGWSVLASTSFSVAG